MEAIGEGSTILGSEPKGVKLLERGDLSLLCARRPDAASLQQTWSTKAATGRSHQSGDRSPHSKEALAHLKFNQLTAAF
jgi:hypothetical protein